MFSFLALGRHWNYAKYLFRHKWYVFLAGRKLGIPILSALHDNSKMRLDEWIPYADYFYLPNGTKRTAVAEDGFTKYPQDNNGFREAWLKHIQRNKHHPQHWIHIYSAKCLCIETPSGVLYQLGITPHRKDVLLNDDGGARCLTCNSKLIRDQLSYGVWEIPMRYRLEMMADWIGAGLAQGNPDTLGWYKARGKNHIFGDDTRAWIEKHLGYVPEKVA